MRLASGDTVRASPGSDAIAHHRAKLRGCALDLLRHGYGMLWRHPADRGAVWMRCRAEADARLWIGCAVLPSRAHVEHETRHIIQRDNVASGKGLSGFCHCLGLGRHVEQRGAVLIAGCVPRA